MANVLFTSVRILEGRVLDGRDDRRLSAA